MSSRLLSCVAACAALSALPAAASAQTEAAWLAEMNVAYGPRFEAVQRPPVFMKQRNDTTDAFSMGLRAGRIFASGVSVLGEVRMAVPAVEGEMAAGVGVGFTRSFRPGVAFQAVMLGGYKQLWHNACECGGLEYSGPWLRTEVGGRYGLFATGAAGVARGRLTAAFDVYVSAALGVDLVFARYPDGSQYGLDVDDRGHRWGVEPVVGVGFLW